MLTNEIKKSSLELISKSNLMREVYLHENFRTVIIDRLVGVSRKLPALSFLDAML